MKERKAPHVGVPKKGMRTSTITGPIVGRAQGKANSSLGAIVAEDHRQRGFLRKILTHAFDEEELRNLSFDMGIDYDKLTGEGKAAKAREPILYLERHCTITKDELLKEIRERRPRLPWTQLLSGQQASHLHRDSPLIERICFFNDSKYSEGAVVCSAGRLLECRSNTPTVVTWHYIKDC